MFDFDHDGDFDLNDMIEADIQYGFFEDDEKELKRIEKKKLQKASIKATQNHSGDIDERINLAIENLDSIIYSGSYEENDLFDYYCDIADLYEEKFQILKNKFLQEYNRIFNSLKKLPDEAYDIDVDSDKLLSIYDEMEDCLCAFDDVLEYEYEYEFEDSINEYSERKEQLETELSKCEEMKDAVEYDSFDIAPISVESTPETTRKIINKEPVKQEKYTNVQYIKPEVKTYSEAKAETDSIKTVKESVHKEPILKEKKTFAEMPIREKIAHIIVISIFTIFAIFILANLPAIISFIVGIIVGIFKFIWEVIQFIFALGFLLVFFFIIGTFKLFK